MALRRFSKTIDAPIRHVYEWCTDFRLLNSDGSATKTDRRILESTRTKCVFVDILKGKGRQVGVAVNVVSLSPPRSWHLDLYGDPRNETVDYELRVLGPTRTRLEMRFKVGLSSIERTWFTKLWEGWASEIKKEYRSQSITRRGHRNKVR